MIYSNDRILMQADATVQELVNAMMDLFDGEVDLARVKGAMIALFTYLASDKGRTDDNCTAVDLFLVDHDAWADAGLPEEYHEILSDAAGCLNDTFSDPDSAKDFDATPEQLLKRTEKL